MIETKMIDGTPVPLVRSAAFLVDLGPTDTAAKLSWLASFRLTLNQAVTQDQMLTVCPVDVVADSKTSGRMVLRVWAPDPLAAVTTARELADGDGPEVQPL
jgi:hypothetical protein